MGLKNSHVVLQGNVTKVKVVIPNCRPGSGPPIAFYLENVFSREECQELIDLTEKHGYEPAVVRQYGEEVTSVRDTSVRNSYQCIIQSTPRADEIWKRIRTYCPKYFKHRKAVGVYETLRFFRYDVGEFFKLHQDGEYVSNARNARTIISVQVYLNEGFKGGNTTFFSHIDKSDPTPVVPKIGSVLIFEHKIYHEGSILEEGRKYILRTGVLYTEEDDHGYKHSKYVKIKEIVCKVPLPVETYSSSNNKEKTAFILENVFKQEKLRAFISRAEKLLIAKQKGSDSSCRECLIEEKKFVNKIWKKAQNYLPGSRPSYEIIISRHDDKCRQRPCVYKTDTHEENTLYLLLRISFDEFTIGGVIQMRDCDQHNRTLSVRLQDGCILVFSPNLNMQHSEIDCGIVYNIILKANHNP